MTQAEHVCLNCGTPVLETFCPRCGQKKIGLHPSLGDVLRDAASETFELDGRVPRTLKPFLLQPGELTRAYMQGRRASFTAPFRLFVAVTLLWAIVSGLVAASTDYEAEIAADEAALGEAPTADRERRLPITVEEDSAPWKKRLGRRYAELEAMTPAQEAAAEYELAAEAFPRAVLFLLPIFASMLGIVHLKTGRVYVEHLVFALHVHAYAFIWVTLAVVIDRFAFNWFALAAVSLYVFLAMKRAYGSRWWSTILRFAVFLPAYGFILGTAMEVFMVVGLAL